MAHIPGGLEATGRPKRYRRALAHATLLAAPLAAVGVAAAMRFAGVSLGTDLAFLCLLLGCIVLTHVRQDCLMWSTFAVGLIAHSVLWNRASSLGADIRFDYVAHVDRVLGLGDLPTVRLQRAFLTPDAPGLHDWLAFAVYISFYGLPLFLLTPLRASAYEAGRRYVSAVLLAAASTWPVFALAPTAPPWLAAAAGHPLAAEVVPWKSMLQGTTTSEYIAAGTNLVAAMPSLHQAIATVCALAIAAAWPRYRWGAAFYVVAMATSLVYLGEHYLADVVAGALLGAGAWTVASLGGPEVRRARRSSPEARREPPLDDAPAREVPRVR